METITVLYRVDGTTNTDTFTAGNCSSQVMPAGRAILTFSDGRDSNGKPVRVVHYRKVEKIMRGPIADETP